MTEDKKVKYDMHSMKAEEFINHEEILETVAYANEHKNDTALVDEILKKAKKRKGAFPPRGKRAACVRG